MARPPQPTVTPATSAQLHQVSHWQAHGVPDYLKPMIVPFVRECVIAAGHVSRRRTTDRLAACAKVAEFSVHHHLPLDPELIFDPANIEAFTESLMGSMPASAAKYRAELRDMGPVLTDKAPWPARVPRVPRTSLAPPYLAPEWRALVSAGRRQPTPIKGRIFQVTTTLGFGCGLDGRWIPKVKVNHIRHVGRHLCVDVAGPAPRLVPIIKRYRTALLHLADGLSQGSYLLTGTRQPYGKNYLSQSLQDLNIPKGTPAMHAGRARSTWLLHHLLLGIRLDILAQAAGFQGTATLIDLFPYMPPMSQAQSLTLLEEQ